uniref:Uncharacterized protein n=1 Tax=Setaria digitata TaxID=48799 RepID=A0A915PEY0_9BILA
MSQSVVSCNNNHHHHHQQQGASNVCSIVAPACSARTIYPATLDDNLPPVGVTDNTSVVETTVFDCSQQTRVIVAPNISSSVGSPALSSSVSASSSLSSAVAVAVAHVPQQQSHLNTEESSSNTALYGSGSASPSSHYLTTHAGYLSGHSSGGPSSMLHSSCSTSSFVYPSNFFQPYYGLSSTLSEFNVLQMCCQPLFTEIASQGTDITPTAESLYGFANRLHPITPTGKHLFSYCFLDCLFEDT